MFARVTRIKGDPARVDELAQHLKSEMVPVFERQQGYLGTIATANRETGEGATTTYWDTMENLKASEAAIFAARDKFAQEQGTEIVSFHRCEVPVMESRGVPAAGQYIRVIGVGGIDASRSEEAIQSFREKAAPVAMAQPGCLAAALLVDRENNAAFAITAWETSEQREASLPALLPIREAAVATSGGKPEVMLAETTYADLKMPVTH